MELVKRIPASAGLGGASSDAAAALVAANAGWKLGLSQFELSQLAAEIGSDVPFFLGTGAAICTGRGEKITPLAPARRLPVVVVRPPEGLSTREVYRACHPSSQPRGVERLVRALLGGSYGELGGAMFNRLQEAARGLSPWIDRLAREFQLQGCGAHQMTGSGSSYFGICRTARQARSLAAQLRSRRLGSVYCAATVGVATGREILPQTA